MTTASRRDPICGMAGVFERDGHWFCSQRCAQLFAQQQAGPPPGCCPTTGAKHRWQDPWLWVPLSGVLMLGLGRLAPRLAHVSHLYLEYLHKVFVPFFAGLVLGGFIDHFIPKTYIVRLLSGPKKRVIARATVLGFLASTCSHGCLALALELFRKGASVPAVVSFLLASPWASMALTFLLLSLFGPSGLTFVAGALVIAYLTGLIFQRLARRHWIDGNPHTVPLEQGWSMRQDIRARFQAYPWTLRQFVADIKGVVDGMIPLGRMVLGWTQLGLVLSSALGALVPQAFFANHFNASFSGIILTMSLAAVIEVCSEGTAPLAFELYRQTGAFGNAFAFLMGGVVTDYTELGALWNTIGRRTVLWLLAVTLPLVLIVGLILNGVRV